MHHGVWSGLMDLVYGTWGTGRSAQCTGCDNLSELYRMGWDPSELKCATWGGPHGLPVHALSLFAHTSFWAWALAMAVALFRCTMTALLCGCLLSCLGRASYAQMLVSVPCVSSSVWAGACPINATITALSRVGVYGNTIAFFFS
jgi:hypothetical protein